MKFAFYCTIQSLNQEGISGADPFVNFLRLKFPAFSSSYNHQFLKFGKLDVGRYPVVAKRFVSCWHIFLSTFLMQEDCMCVQLSNLMVISEVFHILSCVSFADLISIHL